MHPPRLRAALSDDHTYWVTRGCREGVHEKGKLLNRLRCAFRDRQVHVLKRLRVFASLAWLPAAPHSDPESR